MIDPAVLLTLKTGSEMRVLLATSAEPMRLKDIVESPLIDISRRCCIDTLDSLVGLKIITRFTKFGAILYEVPAGIKIAPGGAAVAPRGAKNSPRTRRKPSRNKLNKDSSSVSNLNEQIKGKISNSEKKESGDRSQETGVRRKRKRGISSQ
jgi:hypothetical protein